MSGEWLPGSFSNGFVSVVASARPWWRLFRLQLQLLSKATSRCWLGLVHSHRPSPCSNSWCFLALSPKTALAGS